MNELNINTITYFHSNGMTASFDKVQMVVNKDNKVVICHSYNPNVSGKGKCKINIFSIDILDKLKDIINKYDLKEVNYHTERKEQPLDGPVMSFEIVDGYNKLVKISNNYDYSKITHDFIYEIVNFLKEQVKDCVEEEDNPTRDLTKYGIEKDYSDDEITWECPECGEKNTMKYCCNCGLKKPKS